MKFNIGDDVTLNAKVINISDSGNPIIRTNSGVKMLVKAEDINTVRPHHKASKEDLRKGN